MSWKSLLKSIGWSLAVILVVGVSVAPIQFQAGAQGVPQLQRMSEFSLGDLCPLSGALMSPDGETVWSVVSNCATDNAVSVVGLSVADGSVSARSQHLGIEIAGEQTFFYDPSLSWGGDGTLNVDLTHVMSGVTTSFTVDQESGAVRSVANSPRVLTRAVVRAALPSFGGRLDSVRYSDDRSLAVTGDVSTLYVFDVASGELVTSQTPAPDGQLSWTWFSPDGRHVYATEYVEPDNWDNFAVNLYIYDAATGDQVAVHEVPFAIINLSPDERFALLRTGGPRQNVAPSLTVFDLVNGTLSTSLATASTAITLDTCKNDGRAAVSPWVSDDPTRSSVVWLPDSSGFVTLNSDSFSYGTCLSNDSRLRVYAVTGS
jgi:hypothetical protein